MSEYNLTMSDIVWENGREYSMMFDDEDLIEVVVTGGDFKITKGNYEDEIVTDFYCLDEIAGARFRELVDWSKVPVDTKVLVKRVEEDTWKKRYFAKYENGKVHAWAYRATSWSEENGETFPWNLAKLATEEE